MVKNIKHKFKLFYLPFLSISLIFTILYPLIIWWLYIRSHKIYIMDENILYFYVPVITGLVLSLIFIIPNLRFAIFAKGQIIGIIASSMLSTMFLSIMARANLKYIVDSTTPIISLKQVTDIEKGNLNQSYQFSTLKVDSNLHNHRWVLTGKSQNNLELDLIIPVSDATSSNYSYWILEQRDSFIGNSGIAEYIYEGMLQELNKYLDTVDYTKVQYFERKTRTEHQQYIKSLIYAINSRYTEKRLIILEPRRKPIQQRIKKDMWLAIAAFLGFNLVWLTIIFGFKVSTLKLMYARKNLK